MEKLIIFGRVYSFHSSKSDKTFYTFDYLDAETGEAHHDFISAIAYENISIRKISIGTLCKAVFILNQWNRGEVIDCTSE